MLTSIATLLFSPSNDLQPLTTHHHSTLRQTVIKLYLSVQPSLAFQAAAHPQLSIVSIFNFFSMVPGPDVVDVGPDLENFESSTNDSNSDITLANVQTDMAVTTLAYYFCLLYELGDVYIVGCSKFEYVYQHQSHFVHRRQ